MRSTTNPNIPSSVPLPRKGIDAIEYDEHTPPLFFQWWYAWTALPDPPAPASFVKREVARRSRLLSIITLILIVILIVFLPGSLLAPSPVIFPLNIMLIAVCFSALFFNRLGRVTIAGIMIVTACEVSLTLSIFTTLPLTELSVGFYSLYVVVEFLAVSLLPKGFVFLVAALDSMFIWLSLSYQMKTPTMVNDLHSQFIGELSVPVGLQIIVAGIAFIWVNNANKALRRADRAQVVAALEHKLGQQRAQAGKEKQELEDSIQQLVAGYVEATKNQLTTKISYPPAKVLWPLVGVMNALWLRLQRANQVEQDLQRLEQAITAYTEFLRTNELLVDQSLPTISTKTALDPLISIFGQVHNATRLRHR